MTIQMKNSGAEWIGDVPLNWFMRRVDACAKVVAGHPFDSSQFGADGLPLIRIRDLAPGPFETFYKGIYPSSAVVDNEDILVGMDGDFDVCVWKKGRGLLNQRLAKVIPTSGVDGYFLAYCLMLGMLDLNAETNATTVKHLSMGGIKKCVIPFPAVAEQKAIADFLDRETTLIDKRLALIEEKRALLSELKKSILHEAVTKGLDKSVAMKDSGVEWIGDIPACWEIRRVEQCARVIAGHPFDASKFGLIGMPLVRIRDLQNGPFQTFYDGEPVDSAIIKNGDVLVGMDGDFTVCVWNKGEALLNQRLAKITPSRHIANASYISYVLQFSMDQLNDETNATTVKHLSMGGIRKALVPFPGLDEQCKVVKAIASALAPIVKMDELLKVSTTLLSEQRQSLIHEVVTGKRRVI